MYILCACVIILTYVYAIYVRTCDAHVYNKHVCADLHRYRRTYIGACVQACDNECVYMRNRMYSVNIYMYL